MCVQLMTVLDVTVVNVALPTIHRAMGFGAASLEWLVAAYAITSGGLLIFGGRAGDLYGRLRIFMLGVAVFACASLLAGLAQSELWLILARGAQGIGAAVASPTALSLVASNFPEGSERDRAVGIFAGVSGAGGAVGLLLGGVLTAYASWRWIFFVNVPLAGLALAVAPRVLNESRTGRGRLDAPGAITVTAGMISLVYGLINASSHSWATVGTYGPLSAAIALLGSFAVIERVVPDPLIPRRLLADRNRVGAFCFMLTLATSIFSVSFFITQYLQNIHHYSPIRTGFAFLPMAVGVMIAAFATSRVVKRTGIRVPLVAGAFTAIFGLLLLTRLTPTSSYSDQLAALSLLAVGLGQCFVPLTIAALSGLKEEATGVASALLGTAQQVGGAVGLAVLGTITASTIRTGLRRGPQPPSAIAVAAAITHGYSEAFAGAAILVGLAAVISICAIRSRTPERPESVREGIGWEV